MRSAFLRQSTKSKTETQSALRHFKCKSERCQVFFAGVRKIILIRAGLSAPKCQTDTNPVELVRQSVKLKNFCAAASGNPMRYIIPRKPARGQELFAQSLQKI